MDTNILASLSTLLLRESKVNIHLECHDDKHNKYYSISKEDSEYEIAWGRCGTIGNSQFLDYKKTWVKLNEKLKNDRYKIFSVTLSDGEEITGLLLKQFLDNLTLFYSSEKEMR